MLRVETREGAHPHHVNASLGIKPKPYESIIVFIDLCYYDLQLLQQMSGGNSQSRANNA